MLDIKNINVMKRLFLSMIIACATWVVGLAQETYAVEILPTMNGYVMSDKATAAQGETVTLTLGHAPSYTLEQLLVESELVGGGMSDDGAWEPAMAPAHIMVPTTKVSENIYTFVMPASKVKVTAIFVLMPELRGDVNNDGQVNINDVTALINYLLSGDASAINLQAADCDQNGKVGIGDVTALINYLLSGHW